MKLELLFEGEYVYGGALEVVVSPFDEDKCVQLFGGGDGRVWGDVVTGPVEWVNAPRFRSDGVFTPNVRGLIRTEDGARLRYDTQGFSEMTRPETPNLRRIVATIRFYSKAETLSWLNTAVAIEEGMIDVSTGLIRTRAYLCRHDFAMPEDE